MQPRLPRLAFPRRSSRPQVQQLLTLVMGLLCSSAVTLVAGVRQMAAVTPLSPSWNVKQHCCGESLLGAVTNVDSAAGGGEAIVQGVGC